MTPEEAKRHHSRYSKGARDEDARVGHRVYERHQKRKRERPDSTHVSPYASEEVRQEAVEHLRWLQSRGVGVERLHAVTGISTDALSRLRAGRTQRVTRAVAEKVLAVHLGRIPKRRGRGQGSIRSRRLNPRSGLATTRSTR